MRPLKIAMLLGCLVAVTPSLGALAIGDDPTSKTAAVQADIDRSRMALAVNRLKEAAALAQEAIKLAGNDKIAAVAYEALASALYQNHEIDNAVAALKRAVQIDPAYSPAFISLAGIAYSTGHLPDAKQALEQAIKLSPDLPAAHERLGVVLQDMGDRAGAIREYELGLLHTPPDYVGAKFNLGELYIAAGRPGDTIRLLEPLVKPNSDKHSLLVLGNAYLVAGDAKKAVPLYAQALLYDRNDNAVALALGTAQRLAGLDNASLERLQELVRTAPDSAAAWYQLGLTEAAMQRYDDAKAAFVKAIELEPKRLDIRGALGETLLAAHEPTAALTVFQEMTKADDAGLAAYDGIARAYGALDRPDDAEAALRDAVTRFPKNPFAYAVLGRLLVVHKKDAEALKVLADGTAIAPDEPALLGDTAMAQWHVGRRDDAIATTRHLVNVRPKDPHAKFLLAMLVEDSGDNAQAITLYHEVLAEDPNNADALNNLASSMIDAGKPKDAVPVARHAVEVRPNNADITDTLGWALLKSGQMTEALMMLKTANSLRPRDQTLMYHLAIAQKQSGDAQGARATLVDLLGLPGQFKDGPAARALLTELSK
jgi:tetratricopeptide (TPR) repeat protein